MKQKLKHYFPMIRTREEVLDEIQRRNDLSRRFHEWTKSQQEDFLDFCTGARGVKLLYDSFFKEIINPENAPERLEDFLSLVLRQSVKIKTILPGDSSRIADESSLLILDILVELENGSLANIEVQKIGYMFPGQRCACYSADLLLRQYKRLRSEKKKKFSYRNIQKVYTIVLFEKSIAEFHKFPETCLHYLKQRSDTGLEIEMLQEYFLIPLDIFHKNLHNKGIKNKLDAWLAFLSEDDPGIIEELIRIYPDFIPMYQDIYEMCRNTERVMELYSKELRELDRNTVQLMIDEMQDTIDAQKEQISQKDIALTEKDSLLREKEREIEALKKRLAEKS